ncbi:MAG: phosphoribosylformylglycinamidine synthase subunit PurL [Alphaproteobacteria bacterium]|nr:phosphoribosylformylglycinamidine synthase subunit PurL [Alphaproteobacteria bacterium]
MNAKITPNTIAEHGLTAEEYRTILGILAREPNLTELGIFSVMWSEHCSYKSSKVWLKTLPTSGPRVICGPGENAGVVDIGDGDAAIFKIESHNHPSFIEPYQGAATGVGGILRDVFTMGARPIANLNALRFGAPDHPKTRQLVSGVVAGIGGYGNCVGVPTVGGETNFDPSYNGNCLVNCMTVGLARADRIFYAKAAGPGNPVVYLGAKTGRDGIHGATMASAEFNADSEEKRPTVQVGDPFTEKLLIEACLELMATDAIVAIQDMGAAGLTSSSVEMAGKGGLGIELDLDRVPMREPGMTAYEIMLSESQERMLMVLQPGREAIARRIFDKYELDFAIIGHLTTTGNLTLRRNGQVVADMPIAPMVSEAPQYQRPWTKSPLRPTLAADDVPPIAVAEALVRLMGSPDLCSRRWIWEQYDHLVRGQTVQRPGGDAAVVRLPGGTKGLAMTVDCTPRYCHADPETGGAQAVVETWRNLTAVGATPIAITDNMNFGNPERPEIMGQFAGCIEGMRRACVALDYPVVSGNVSLYNETQGRAILPAPVIGGVGLLADVGQSMDLAFKRPGETIVLLGETRGWLGCSLYLRELCRDGDLAATTWAPPPVDLAAERRAGDLVRRLIAAGHVTACHDVSDGGLLVAIAEMALAGNAGCALSSHAGVPAHAFWFGEDQGRYVITTAAPGQALAAAREAGVSMAVIGTVEAGPLTLDGTPLISLQELRAVHEAWLPRYMDGA